MSSWSVAFINVYLLCLFLQQISLKQMNLNDQSRIRTRSFRQQVDKKFLIVFVFSAESTRKNLVKLEDFRRGN